VGIVFALGLLERWKDLGYWFAVIPHGGFALMTTLLHFYGE